MKALTIGMLALGLGACATAPKPLQGEFAALSPAQASAEQAAGGQVRWGGSIVSVTPSATETCIEVLGRALNSSARPALSADDVSAGRFIACRAGFYDPAIFAAEREVTVTGHVAGYETRRIGEYDYRYPRVSADVIYLWPERRDVDVYYHPVSFWPAYRPFWWGGYYFPRAVPRPPREKTESP